MQTITDYHFTVADVLPVDADEALLVGRAWLPDCEGPSPVIYHKGDLYDLSAVAPTISELLELEDLPQRLTQIKAQFATQNSHFKKLCSLEQALQASLFFNNRSEQIFLLSPFDLQAIKACGVTFAASMLERVIEERAGGDLEQAASLRAEITATIGNELAKIKPGSDAALRLKEVLIEKGVWSQYLEVGIGPYAEVFTKAQVLSSVGWGCEAGLHSASVWNNPEPEIVLAVNSQGRICGATLGNDVNLRDIEGRSALLLGKAKDNNASCAIGPFIRLLDKHFNLDDIANADVRLQVVGTDGFEMQGLSSMSKISRSPEELVAQTCGNFHQYPDGFALFLGTMFAPVEDRSASGKGFTHKVGDRVSISSSRLGSLTNWVNFSEQVSPWTFGARALMKNLAKRGLL